MSPSAASRERPLSIAECPVCSGLGDVERSYAKWGWDEQTVTLPDAAGHLVPAEGSATADMANSDTGSCVYRCPTCGTFYRYTWSSDYLANGSEERAELFRLAPAQARAWMDDAEYGRLMEWMGLWLSHNDAAVRRHASRSLAAHHCAAGDCGVVSALLGSPDPEVVRGALLVLRDAVNEGVWALDLQRLAAAIATLQSCPDAEIAAAAQYLSQELPPDE